MLLYAPRSKTDVLSISNYPVNILDVKAQLRLDTNIVEDDNYIVGMLIPAATQYCENKMQKAVTLKTKRISIYNFFDYYLRVVEGNFLSVDKIITDSSTLITSYTKTESDTCFTLEFDSILSSNPLKIEYTTGYSNIDDCPSDIKIAILMACGDMYDVQRNSFTLGNIKREYAIDRLLMPYCLII
jgi:hypothetical protein